MTTKNHRHCFYYPVIASPKGEAIPISADFMPRDCRIATCRAFGSQLQLTLAMTTKNHRHCFYYPVIASPKGEAIPISADFMPRDCRIATCRAFGSQLQLTLAMTTKNHRHCFYYPVIASPKGEAIPISADFMPRDCRIATCRAFGSQLQLTLAMTTKTTGIAFITRSLRARRAKQSL